MLPARPRLREARAEAGLTQVELAGLIGARQPHVARWESGAQVPRVDTALRLAQALNTTVEALWQAPEPNTKRGRDAGTSGPMTAHGGDHEQHAGPYPGGAR